MKKFWIALLALFLIDTSALAQNNARPIFDNTPQGGASNQGVDSGSHPLPVSIFGGGSAASPTTTYNKNLGVTTYTKTSLTLNGSSQTLLAASNTRNAITVYNPTTNANAWIDISGGTATAETGSLLAPGTTFVITGSAVPKTAITVIGTNTQVLSVQEGH